MTGVSSRRPRAAALLAVVVAALGIFPRAAAAQSPADQGSLPAAPDPTPAVSTGLDNSQLPPYAPSNNAASPLLPALPPLPPHPSVPTLSLLPPDSTPPPVSPPPPLPVPDQTGSNLSPTSAGTVLTNGAPGTTPATEVPGGATFTNNTGAVRRFQYAFRLSTGVTYDDNVFLTSDDATPAAAKGAATPAPINQTPRRGVSRQDVYFFIDPAVSLGYGDFITRATNYIEFDYNADVLLYAKNTDQDTVQHFVNLQGAYHFAEVTLTLTQGVQILNSTEISSNNSGGTLAGSTGAASAASTQVNLDASQRTGLNIFTTRVDANYAFSPKTSVDLDGYFSAYDYASLISSQTISGDAYFNYTPTGKITFGLGVTEGYVLQDEPAPDEFYQQLNGRLNYAATGKLSLGGTLGIEVRETSGRTVVNPIFDLSVTYSPFDSTSLALSASRRTETSAVLVGQDFDSTGFSFSVSQRLFQRVTARLSLGYTHSAYANAGNSSINSAAADRTDDYYYVQPSLDYSIRDNLSAGVVYTHRQNLSSLSGSGFSDNQISAHLSFNF